LEAKNSTRDRHCQVEKKQNSSNISTASFYILIGEIKHTVKAFFTLGETTLATSLDTVTTSAVKLEVN
jgi:hypothetical protein